MFDCRCKRTLCCASTGRQRLLWKREVRARKWNLGWEQQKVPQPVFDCCADSTLLKPFKIVLHLRHTSHSWTRFCSARLGEHTRLVPSQRRLFCLEIHCSDCCVKASINACSLSWESSMYTVMSEEAVSQVEQSCWRMTVCMRPPTQLCACRTPTPAKDVVMQLHTGSTTYLWQCVCLAYVTSSQLHPCMPYCRR